MKPGFYHLCNCHTRLWVLSSHRDGAFSWPVFHYNAMKSFDLSSLLLYILLSALASFERNYFLPPSHKGNNLHHLQTLILCFPHWPMFIVWSHVWHQVGIEFHYTSMSNPISWIIACTIHFFKGVATSLRQCSALRACPVALPRSPCVAVLMTVCVSNFPASLFVQKPGRRLFSIPFYKHSIALQLPCNSLSAVPCYILKRQCFRHFL